MDKIIKDIFEDLRYNPKILLLGSGGGSDIFSCLLIADILKNNIPNLKVDLAGMLSPASIHCYKDNLRLHSRERPVNLFDKTTQIHRQLIDSTKISFVDEKLWDAIHYMELENVIQQTFHLSCRFGTERARMALKDVCLSRGYDKVIVVDVGGDILANVESTTVLSPIMDWTALNIVKDLTIPCFVLEFGFGVDGESVGKIPGNLVRASKKSDIAKHQTSIRKFSKMFENVMKPVRSGHTIPLFLNAIKIENRDCGIFSYPHSYSYRIDGKVVFEDKFERHVDEHPADAFLIPHYMFKCEEYEYKNPAEFMLNLKNKNPLITTEMDGHLFELQDSYNIGGLPSLKTQYKCFNALISKRISDKCRIPYINEAIAFCRLNGFGLLLFKSDIPTSILTKTECSLLQQVKENIVFLPCFKTDRSLANFEIRDDD